MSDVRCHTHPHLMAHIGLEDFRIFPVFNIKHSFPKIISYTPSAMCSMLGLLNRYQPIHNSNSYPQNFEIFLWDKYYFLLWESREQY